MSISGYIYTPKRKSPLLMVSNCPCLLSIADTRFMAAGVVPNGDVAMKDSSLLTIFKQNEKRRQLLLSFESEENEEAPLSIKQLVEELVQKNSFITNKTTTDPF